MSKSTFPIKLINTLKVDFDNQGTAYSNNYADIYFQPGIGLDEKRHVFLAGNDLPQNWQDKDNFVIAETGFGTGLNFLMTWQAWENNKGNCKRLDFISCELHPMNKSQLSQALASFPELKQYSEQLINKYPNELLCGIHRLEFITTNITLTLIFADASSAYQQLNTQVDAWYLDGFGPSKNPEMWTDDLFQAIANLSKIGTTAATFTVARKIRDGLNRVGFEINKSEGFGQKREMLKACFQDTSKKTLDKQPWAVPFQPTRKRNITVIGAGIAGMTLATKLIQKGENVTLIDRNEKPCSEASGNPQAMVMPMFTLNDSNESRFYLRAFQYAKHFYDSEFFHQDGVLQLAVNDKEKLWQQKFLSNFDLPESLIRNHKDGLLYPTSGWLDTQGHAQKQFQNITHYIQAEVNKIEFIDGQWLIFAEDQQIHNTDVLILANGIQALRLLKDYQLPITPKHGQISYFKTDPKMEFCNHQQVLLHEGYITPHWKGEQTLGATFDHVNNDYWFDIPTSDETHWQRNTDLWKGTEIFDELKQITPGKARAGIRVTTPDHLPLCGPIINQQQFKEDYSELHHGRHWQQFPQPKAIENLYLFTGLGSRGYTSAPLLAEFLSNQILGLPQILEDSMQKNINPNRFLFKTLRRL